MPRDTHRDPWGHHCQLGSANPPWVAGWWPVLNWCRVTRTYTLHMRSKVYNAARVVLSAGRYAPPPSLKVNKTRRTCTCGGPVPHPQCGPHAQPSHGLRPSMNTVDRSTFMLHFFFFFMSRSMNLVRKFVFESMICNVHY